MSTKATSNKRKIIKSTVVCCPIIYGSIATHLEILIQTLHKGKKSEEFSTHKWKLYIRGPNYNDNLSSFIEKVAFTLHSSFKEPIREIYEAPFEVIETGWGEFEASIRLYFKDHDQQPIDLFHNIKLYPSGSQQPLNIKKSVVDEQYDEIIFNEPSEEFYHQLLGYTTTTTNAITKNTTTTIHQSDIGVSGGNITHPPPSTTTSFHQQECFKTSNNYGSVVFDDSIDIERLASIEKHLADEIKVAKVKLMEIETKVIEILEERRLEQLNYNEKQKQQLSTTTVNNKSNTIVVPDANSISITENVVDNLLITNIESSSTSVNNDLNKKSLVNKTNDTLSSNNKNNSNRNSSNNNNTNNSKKPRTSNASNNNKKTVPLLSQSIQPPCVSATIIVTDTTTTTNIL